jgi:hypothetical protein
MYRIRFPKLLGLTFLEWLVIIGIILVGLAVVPSCFPAN